MGFTTEFIFKISDKISTQSYVLALMQDTL